MYGLPRPVIEHYGEFARLPDALERRGVSQADIRAVLGGNYLRALREALTVSA